MDYIRKFIINGFEEIVKTVKLAAERNNLLETTRDLREATQVLAQILTAFGETRTLQLQ